MRLHVLGDLHLEFGSIDIPPTAADVVVLAGDIDVGTKGLPWIESHSPGLAMFTCSATMNSTGTPFQT
jgi:hypothetical protein